MQPVIHDLHAMIDFPADGILSKVLLKSDDFNHTLFCMAKATDISEHTSTRDAFVTVLQGKGVFFLNGEEIALKPGMFLFIPANTPHAVRADDNLAILLSLV